MAEVETPLAPSIPSTTSAQAISRSPSPQPLDSTALATTSTSNEVTIATGSLDVTAAADRTKKLIRRKRRPARPQVDPSTLKSEPPPQTGTIFNIWYNKWSGGDREDKYLSQTHAQGRCSVATDSGYTRADRVTGSYFCLFFAKGLCPKGHECEYLHRLPGLHDHFNPNIDCFGRDKHSDYRDDMGGVGSFMRQNRTLYIGRIHVTDDIEEVVARHFAEWGEVERARVLTGRGVAFVTYVNEANSQFAKEAMAHQSLDHDEILNVRWATMDPNPLAQKREARRVDEQAAEAVRRALPAEFVAELEGRDPEAIKRKKIEGGFGLDGYQAPDEVWYARSRAVEGSGERMLLEAAGAVPSAIGQVATQADGGGGSGILSSSTLAALRGYSVQNLAGANQASTRSGPLVGYGSDDESD